MQDYARKMSPSGKMDVAIDRTLKLIDARAKSGDLKASTRRKYHQYAKAVRTAFTNFAPHQVKHTHIAEFMDFNADRPSTANQYLVFLRILFKNCVRWGYTETNPCIGIDRLKERVRDRYITDDEYTAIREAASPRLKLVMDMCYLTGQRISDVLAVTRRDITDEGVYFKQEKTGSKLSVAMTPELNDLIEQIKGSQTTACALLFHKRGKPIRHWSIWNDFDAARQKVGIDDVVVHDIRAKSITDANEEGKDAQKLSGHANASMTKRYIRLRGIVKAQGPKNLQMLRQSK